MFEVFDFPFLFDSTAGLRGQLEQTMKEATVYGNQIAQEENDQALTGVRKSGKTVVYEPTKEERLALKDAMAPVHTRLAEIRRVLRAAALAALQRAVANGLFALVQELHFDTPLFFRDFDEFYRRMVGVTHSDIRLEGERLDMVRRRFETHMTPAGARFARPMRVNLLRSRG